MLGLDCETRSPPTACRRLLAVYKLKLQEGYFEAFRPRTLDQGLAEHAVRLDKLASDNKDMLRTLLLAIAASGRGPGLQAQQASTPAIPSETAVQAEQLTDEEWTAGFGGDCAS